MTTLVRPVLVTERTLDFFSEAALTRQMGYAKHLWPLVTAKELIDNSLDAAETAGVPPEISMVLEADSLKVSDNGPGLKPEIVERTPDYSVQVSTNRFFVSPTRGQLGNALKSILAAPCVVAGKGLVEIKSCGTTHAILLELDSVTGQPRIGHSQIPDASVKTGATVTLRWSGIASLLTHKADGNSYRKRTFADALPGLIQAFAAFNPHANFSLSCMEKSFRWTPTNPDWQKWRASDPTSAYWYSVEAFSQLIAAYTRNNVRRTLRDFVAEFAGLSGTQVRKRVLEEAGLQEAHLEDLVVSGCLAQDEIDRLLTVMKKYSRPLKPGRLGILGRNHVIGAVSRYGGAGARYGKVAAIDEAGLPYVIEIGFGIKPTSPFKLVVGLNHSCVFKIPSQSISTALASCHIQKHDPVVVFLHAAGPGFSFTDQGKGAVEDSPEMSEAFSQLLASLTKEFVREKLRAVRRNRQEQLSAEQHKKLSQRVQRFSEEEQIKTAAYAAMPRAYRIVSDAGKLPVNARQMMYQVRPAVLDTTGGKCWKNSSYFTQHLLPNFQAEHEDECRDWDIVYDARGHLREPHQSGDVDLGTLGVRSYISSWEQDEEDALQCPSIISSFRTSGPRNRFKYALFIEKEGFDPLLARAEIAERFDVAIFSSKGQSTTATRTLVEALSKAGVTILVVHDFDRAGLLILHYLSSDSRRFRFDTAPRVIDLGLRLFDVNAMALQSEPVSYSQQKHPGEALASVAGITQEEIDFLVTKPVQRGHWTGQRVELNAMTSRQFVQWLEKKLREHGVSKVIPDETTLGNAYRAAKMVADIGRVAQDLTEQARVVKIQPPADLDKKISKLLRRMPSLSWDGALNLIAAEQD